MKEEIEAKMKRETNSDLDIDTMLNLIISKFPDIKDKYIKISEKLFEEFGYKMSSVLIEHYFSMISLGEDYELESRRRMYDYRL